MELNDYIKQYSTRKEFAKLIGVKLSYLHNLCQHPEQVGKKTIQKIELATGGSVTFGDMVPKQTKQSEKNASI